MAGLLGADERARWHQTIGFGAQHVVAMAGATLLVPLLTGFPISATLLFSGVGTLVFLAVTRNRLPTYVGSSLAFIAPLQAAKGEGLAGQLGGVLVVGLVLALVGVVVKAIGPKMVRLLLPPLVTGGIVILLGLSLAPRAAEWLGAQPLVGVVTLLAIMGAAVGLPGTGGRLAVLIGVLAGWGLAAVSGGLDEARLAALRGADWVGPPTLHAPEIRPAVVLAMLPVVLVLIAENIGHLKAVGAITGRQVDSLAGDTLIANGMATTLAGLGGGCGTTARPENLAVLLVSRVRSTAAYVVAALIAIGLSASPKFAAMVATVPAGVAGGAGLVLGAVVAFVGLRVWLDNQVELVDPATIGIAVLAMVAGLGGLAVTIGDVSLGGLTWGSVGIIVLAPSLRALRRRLTQRTGAATERGTAS